MIPFQLTSWFRARMLPLVIVAALVVQVSAPLSYYLTKRHELWRDARADATLAALILHAEIDQRPTLWRYNAPKLLERLAAEGLIGTHALEIRTQSGQLVPLEPLRLPPRPLWGSAEVWIRGEIAATVWVAVDTSPLLQSTALVSAAFFGLALLLGMILYLVPVYVISIAQRRIQALLGELALTLQEDDRCRIARDLHDGAGQVLTAARLRLLALNQSSSEGESVGQIAQLLDDALEEVRRSVHALTPPALHELGLEGALQRHCQAFAAASALTVYCDVQPLPSLRSIVQNACYRIVQESISNSARHSGAKHAWVQLQQLDGCLHLSIYDDGKVSVQPSKEGFGLIGIRERARLLGGKAQITCIPGHAMKIEVEIPI